MSASGNMAKYEKSRHRASPNGGEMKMISAMEKWRHQWHQMKAAKL
jgi:hypothetical protein